SGLHFERRNLKILERGLMNRMTALRIGSYLDYYDYLIQHRESRQELQKLLQFLTVGETYFFRYHAHFNALRRFLETEVAPDRKRPLRLWSAGCSTGEEPYSLAMTVMEALPDWRERDIRIYATDINNRALRRARDGVYGSWAMRATEQYYLDRYFDKVGKSYLLRSKVKELVEFSHLNLQTDTFPVQEGAFHDLDVIFCRNVMIYFTVATTREIVEKFADSLVPDGFLFLGHAETLAYISTRFERRTQDGGFYYQKKNGNGRCPEPELKTVQAPKAPVLPAQPPRQPVPQTVARVAPKMPVQPPRPAPPEASQPDLAKLYHQATTLFDAERFGEASQLVNKILRHQPDHEGALVIHGFVLANNGHFDEALELCAQLHSMNDLLPEGYFLKGLILDMLDRVAEAVEEYRKAILLRMEFVMPHYSLGRLHIRQGKTREGTRELRNCLKILEKEGAESVVPFSGGLSREVFLEQLRNSLTKVDQERGRR
ncbi:MAG TPA: CheR family methyltransferase, partial [Geobacteraceae bacterium]